MPDARAWQTDSAPVLCLCLLLLAPLAAAGLALINTGLHRSRVAAHGIFSALCAMAVSTLAFCILGFAFFDGNPAVRLREVASWIGGGPMLLAHIDLAGVTGLHVLFGIVAAGIGAIVPLSSGAERWRLGSFCASTAIWAGWTFPLLAHWVWRGGWLAQIGFVDPGGAACIHAAGGSAALPIAWLLGPRRGKYTARAFPPPCRDTMP